MKKGEIQIYTTKKGVEIQANLGKETIWLTQKQISELFGTEGPAVNKHIKNIYKEGELLPELTISKMEIVQQEGKRRVVRNIEHYNLDLILSVDYRLNSKRGTQFRQWLPNYLKNYLAHLNIAA